MDIPKHSIDRSDGYEQLPKPPTPDAWSAPGQAVVDAHKDDTRFRETHRQFNEDDHGDLSRAIGRGVLAHHPGDEGDPDRANPDRTVPVEQEQLDAPLVPADSAGRPPDQRPPGGIDGNDGGDGGDNGDRISEDDEGRDKRSVRSHCINQADALVGDLRELVAERGIDILEAMDAAPAIAHIATVAASDYNTELVEECCETITTLENAPAYVDEQVLAEAGLAEVAVLGREQSTLLKRKLLLEMARRQLADNDYQTGFSPILEATVRECARRGTDASEWIAAYSTNEQDRWFHQAMYNKQRIEFLQEQRHQNKLDEIGQQELIRMEGELTNQADTYWAANFEPEFVINCTAELITEDAIAPIMLQKFLSTAMSATPTLFTIGELATISREVYRQFSYNELQVVDFFDVATTLANRYVEAGGDPDYAERLDRTMRADMCVSFVAESMAAQRGASPDPIATEIQYEELTDILRTVIEVLVLDVPDDGPVSDEHTEREQERDRLYERCATALAERSLFQYSKVCVDQIVNNEDVPAVLRDCWNKAETLQELVQLPPVDAAELFYPEIQTAYEIAQLCMIARTAVDSAAPMGELGRALLDGFMPTFQGDETLTLDEAARVLVRRAENLDFRMIQQGQFNEDQWEILMQALNGMQRSTTRAHTLAQILVYRHIQDEAPEVPYEQMAPLLEYSVTNPGSTPLDYRRARDYIDKILDPIIRLKALGDLATWLG